MWTLSGLVKGISRGPIRLGFGVDNPERQVQSLWRLPRRLPSGIKGPGHQQRAYARSPTSAASGTTRPGTRAARHGAHRYAPFPFSGLLTHRFPRGNGAAAEFKGLSIASVAIHDAEQRAYERRTTAVRVLSVGAASFTAHTGSMATESRATRFVTAAAEFIERVRRTAGVPVSGHTSSSRVHGGTRPTPCSRTSDSAESDSASSIPRSMRDSSTSSELDE